MLTGTEHKIFDPLDHSLGTTGDELLDSSVVKRNGLCWMFLAGQAHGQGAPNIFSANLPKGTPLSAEGWIPVRDASGELMPLAGNDRSGVWDLAGGRHCPAYVKGWDPKRRTWVERIYYAGGAKFLWGPYCIGYLEWDGEEWIDQASPCFKATEEWEHGSVYEPNVIWHDGKWRIWYVAGSNQENYLVHGYSDSEDGEHWGAHTIFAPEEMKMFDFCVRQRDPGFDAVFSRVHIGEDAPSSETGLWWCYANKPSGRLHDWSKPIQIMTAEDRGWHRGPFKPSLQLDEDEKRAWIFFNGVYNTGAPGPFPFAFTLGCLEISLPNR
jgi:hypothetical protein